MANSKRVGRDPQFSLSDTAADLIGREKTFGARNYDPLPVVLARDQCPRDRRRDSPGIAPPTACRGPPAPP